MAGSLTALDLATDSARRTALHRKTIRFRDQLTAAGVRLLPGEHPIVSVMFGDAAETVCGAACVAHG